MRTALRGLLRMPAGAMTERMVAAVPNPDVDVLGHCTGQMVLGRGRPELAFDSGTVFSRAEEAGVTPERVINSRPADAVAITR